MAWLVLLLLLQHFCSFGNGSLLCIFQRWRTRQMGNLSLFWFYVSHREHLRIRESGTYLWQFSTQWACHQIRFNSTTESHQPFHSIPFEHMNRSAKQLRKRLLCANFSLFSGVSLGRFRCLANANRQTYLPTHYPENTILSNIASFFLTPYIHLYIHTVYEKWVNNALFICMYYFFSCSLKRKPNNNF